jgi:hypothetical protein
MGESELKICRILSRHLSFRIENQLRERSDRLYRTGSCSDCIQGTHVSRHELISVFRSDRR